MNLNDSSDDAAGVEPGHTRDETDHVGGPRYRALTTLVKAAETLCFLDGGTAKEARQLIWQAYDEVSQLPEVEEVTLGEG